jgi:hypothetical protein
VIFAWLCLAYDGALRQIGVVIWEGQRDCESRNDAEEAAMSGQPA